ncbi:MAG: GNAT family N-acetyltransferase [Dinghuibacter sp.]|nr:GNAT family N-acetyltransferase [Dinghuibacter sp.]
MELNIREAVAGDARAISELVNENALAILRPHYSDEQWEVFIRYYSEQAVLDKIATQTFFCGTMNDQIVGTIALDGNFVVGFYTRVSHLKQGIGKTMMHHLEQFARNAGITELQLAASPEGVPFYLHNGWEKVNNLVMVYLGVGFEETLMKKQLAGGDQ